MKRIFIYFLLSASTFFAQNFQGGFNFNMPYNDSASKKFLPVFPARPIGNSDFVIINPEGHFSAAGTQIRFWGGNCPADGAFPAKTDAPAIAGRLRKMGFNMIRFHHMDNPWSDGSLLFRGQSTRRLNPVVLDRLEYFVKQLKINGIYADINLNVGRTFVRADGVPDADSLVDYAKGVTLFDPWLISLQKEYAWQLLTHKNPYTGIPLAEDPVMGLLEITNENSLYRMWISGALKHFSSGGRLTWRHNKMLDSLWNSFLLNKYSSADNLRQAWSPGIKPAGNNIIKNGDFESSFLTPWSMEQYNTARAVFLKDKTNPYAGSYSCKVVVANATSQSWNLQLKNTGATVIKDSVYTVRFAARADSGRKINVTAMRNNDPYTYYSGQDFILTTQWKVYSFSFKAPENNSAGFRLSFQFTEKGTFWFDDASVSPVNIDGLMAGEDPSKGNVGRISYSEAHSFSIRRIKDMSSFYIKLEDDFFTDITSYLKNTLKVKCPIVGMNWNTGLGDLAVQEKMDYVDNHAYWQHPQFPNSPWSATDWLIPNTSMLKEDDGGTLGGLFAGAPVAGKPYTISEYNHPFPNRYQSELTLIMAAYSSFHDADGIMFYEYNSTPKWNEDYIGQYFSIHRNPVLMAMMPSCALAYRNGIIAKSVQPVEISYSRDFIEQLPAIAADAWGTVNTFPKELALEHAVRTGSCSAASTTDFSKIIKPVRPYKTDTGEITLDPEDGLLSVSSGKFEGAAGFLSGGEVSAGAMKVKNASGFFAVTWISVDGNTLSDSKRTLLTIVSKAQNTGMIWDGITTVHDKWGSAPTLVSPLSIKLDLRISADSICVYPLDATGQESSSDCIKVKPSGPDHFELGINQNYTRTLWYGIEKYGNGSGVRVGDDNIRKNEFRLDQNYPNPFNPSTSISYSLPGVNSQHRVTIKIYDALGRKVKTEVDEYQSPGRHNYVFDASGLPSGMYIYTLRSEKYFASKKMLVIR